MMSPSDTSLIEDEGMDVDRGNRDGVEREGGAANLDCLDLNCASLRLTVVLSMAHTKVKWSDAGKRIEKWRKILVIAQGKMSLSQDIESL